MARDSVSVYRKSAFCRKFETDERIELIFGTGASFDLSNSVLYEKNPDRPYLQNKRTFLWNFVPNLDLENFALASRSCCQQNSSTVEVVDHTFDGRRVVAECTYSSVDRNTKGVVELGRGGRRPHFSTGGRVPHSPTFLD